VSLRRIGKAQKTINAIQSPGRNPSNGALANHEEGYIPVWFWNRFKSHSVLSIIFKGNLDNLFRGWQAWELHFAVVDLYEENIS